MPPSHRAPTRRTLRLVGAFALAVGLALPGPAAAQEADLGALLQQMHTMAEQALDAARAAAEATTEGDVKRYADAVYSTVWGVPSGLRTERGAAHVHGWKTRWQSTYTDFDPAFAARYGSAPPEITDPTQLGIAGLGRHVRTRLLAMMDDGAGPHTSHVVAALNNVIGHQMMDDGVTKAERQPRVDLTRYWDAPSDFWNTTADTGWLFEVQSQALNILKTDYDGDLAMARRHAAGLAALAEKVLTGLDADGDGRVAPVMMEGGLRTALEHARLGGIVNP